MLENAYKVAEAAGPVPIQTKYSHPTLTHVTKGSDKLQIFSKIQVDAVDFITLRFNYAWGLVRSHFPNDLHRGITLLHGTRIGGRYDASIICRNIRLRG